MFSHKLRGSWDRVAGFNRELLGEVLGNDELFTAGQRQRLVGWFEYDLDLNHRDALRKTEDLSL